MLTLGLAQWLSRALERVSMAPGNLQPQSLFR